MKRPLVLTVAIVAVPVAFAQSGGMEGVDMPDVPMKGLK